jgi:hypothetical protein
MPCRRATGAATGRLSSQVTIQRALAEGLPRAYSLVEMRQKSDVMCQHVADSSWAEGRGLHAVEKCAQPSYRVDGVEFRRDVPLLCDMIVGGLIPQSSAEEEEDVSWPTRSCEPTW